MIHRRGIDLLSRTIERFAGGSWILLLFPGVIRGGDAISLAEPEGIASRSNMPFLSSSPDQPREIGHRVVA
jgi:hypothetical protein